MIASQVEALQAQFSMMMLQAKRLDERGYCVLVHGLNKDASNDSGLYNQFSGAMLSWLEQRRQHGARRAVVVHVWPDLATFTPADPFVDVTFNVTLPRRIAWRPLVSAIEIMSAKVVSDKGHRFTRGNGVFAWEELSSFHKFSGHGRTALETLLRIFELPHNRRILTEL
jgi:hypothetical protein